MMKGKGWSVKVIKRAGIKVSVSGARRIVSFIKGRKEGRGRIVMRGRRRRR